MKKYVLKATALAIGALVGNAAVAAVPDGVNFDGAPPAVSTYAKELAYNSTTPLAAIAAINVQSKLGFGVSSAQTRYIRIDYANATLDAAHAAVGGTDIDINGHVNADTYAVVQGGGVGDNYVIYQVTAAVDHPASHVLRVKTPRLRVSSTSSSVNVTYTLHETAVSAVAGAAGTAKLYSKSQDIVKFDTGLAFKIDEQQTVTASVEESFLKFKNSGGGYINPTTAKIGNITVGAVAGVKKHDGTTDVTYGDLVATGTKVVLTGDTGIPFGADDDAKKNSVFISGNANCGSVSKASSAVPTATGASFATNTTTYTNQGVCYVVNGTSPISASTYSVRLDVTAAAGATTASVADKALGAIIRDGTELQAPFATIYAGTGNRAVLTSTHSSDAVVTASAITEKDVTCNTGTTSWVLKAGKQLFINASEVCPTLSAGTRFALKFIIAAPTNKITGVYNSYTYDAATTKVTDLSSYPLLRPAN